jgi:hypothetical protein
MLPAHMSKSSITKFWTEVDVAKLIALADAGASLLRASSALNRPSSSVTKKARELGKSFPGVRAMKARIRDLEPNN